jgi:P27 family predicted phage terminase small subunit
MNVDEPETAVIPLTVPEELADCPVAVSEWERTIVPAIERGQITAPDRAFAIAHCDLWATWREQVAEAALDGRHVIETASGRRIPNPARTMANATLALLAKVDAELGFTPSSRSRVKVAPQHKKSAVEQFLAEKVQAQHGS